MQRGVRVCVKRGEKRRNIGIRMCAVDVSMHNVNRTSTEAY